MQRPPRRRQAALRIEDIQRSISSAHGSENAAEAGHPNAQSHRSLVEDLESILAEDIQLDADQRDTIVRQYAEALRKGPIEVNAPDLEGLKNSFSRVIDTMIEEEALAPFEREELERQMQDVLHTLDTPDIKRANEYAARLQRDGAEAAAKWLADQSVGQSDGDGPDLMVPSHASSPTPSIKRRRRV